MSKNELLSMQDTNEKISKLTELIESENLLNDIEDAHFQKLLEKMIMFYVSKVQNDDQYQIINKTSPLPTKPHLTQTETAIFVDQLLKQMEIEVFELQMWRSMK